MARNFLNTILPTIERDRSRIRLPERTLRATIAYGHRWLGEQLLATQNRVEARHHLRESLRWQSSSRTWGLCALSYLPGLSIPILRWVAHLAGRLRRSPAATAPAAPEEPVVACKSVSGR